jgi:hypothetical protein
MAITFDPSEVLRLLANNLGYYATTEIVVTLKFELAQERASAKGQFGCCFRSPEQILMLI